MSTERWADEVAETGSADRAHRHADATSSDSPDMGIHMSAVPSPEVWRLRLYVSGESARSMTAFANLKRLCDTFLPDRHRLEVVDLLEHPSLAQDEGIVAVPTLVRISPLPTRTIVGDLSDLDEVLAGLQIRTKRS
jgi:circadian clock protein KaiB